MTFWGTQTVTGREPPGPVWAPERASEALSCPLFLVPWLRSADLPAEGCHRQQGDCSTHCPNVHLHQKARSLYLKFRFQWDSCICLAALTTPPLHWWGGGFSRPSRYKQRKSSSRSHFVRVQGHPQGELLKVDYWSLMEFVMLLDSAGFLSSGCRQSTPH